MAARQPATTTATGSGSRMPTRDERDERTDRTRDEDFRPRKEPVRDREPAREPAREPGRELGREQPRESGRRPPMNEYFIEGDGINRAVLQAEICKYLGAEAVSRPGKYNVW
jgi:hypothetical protein